jgi:hypothetical protein
MRRMSVVGRLLKDEVIDGREVGGCGGQKCTVLYGTD